ncbi:MAG: hypothetical protein Q9184_004512 [Pyrenodesmia sp. 2 TL-2023]
MATPNTENLVKKNEEYASTFDQGHLKAPPAKKYAIVTCMDARIHAPQAFGLGLGDAHIIRNAGGSARDAYRSLVVSEQMLGTNEIMLIKHTKCGMVGLTNDAALDVVHKNCGEEAKKECEGMEFHGIGHEEEGVRDDVEWLKAQKAIPNSITITGWIYDVETGKVREVK